MIAIIPTAPVTVAGVAAFGPWWGFFLSLFGTVAGSVVAFAIGRRFGRLMVAKLVGKKVLNKYSGKMAADGWWMLAALVRPLAGRRRRGVRPGGALGDLPASLRGLERDRSDTVYRAGGPSGFGPDKRRISLTTRGSRAASLKIPTR